VRGDVCDVVVRPIAAGEVGRFNELLTAHHWLGHRLTGQVMRYVATLDGRWVALVGFGSAVLSCAARDAWVGWSREQQYARLRHVANNQRFCVLPEGRRANLASAVLGRVLRRLSRDYLAVYGHRVVAVETFTDPARHTGACYAAANFTPVGHTLGFSRSAGSYHHHGNPKLVWMRPLRRDAAGILSAVFSHPLLSRWEGHVVDVNTMPLVGEGGLLAAFAKLTDPRKKRGIRHQVAAVLTMAVAAALAGAQSFTAIAEFVADLPQEALSRLGARVQPSTGRRVAPSEPTIRRTIKSVNADEADRLVGAWLLAQVRSGRIKAGQLGGRLALALDGKVLKGSWEELPLVKTTLFSALVHAEGVIVGQRGVPDTTNEITQVRPLLESIAAGGDLSGVVVTADALHTQREMARWLTEEQNGDYVLTVKKNQPTLYRDVKALFEGSFSPSPRQL
jgi:Domain of unknown function (DUF4338)/DDE_Tnp_1-associated/Transposase DDE domain